MTWVSVSDKRETFTAMPHPALPLQAFGINAATWAIWDWPKVCCGHEGNSLPSARMRGWRGGEQEILSPGFHVALGHSASNFS